MEKSTKKLIFKIKSLTKTYNILLFSALLFGGTVICFGANNTNTDADTLYELFKTPPTSAKPHTWWHWMNGNISAEGITKDLEAMKSAGLGGFMLWNCSEGIPKGPVDFMSNDWWKMLKYTISEAERLGLEMSIFNGGGWSSSGGPWVTPDKAMQEVVWTEKQLTGPMQFDGLLEIPEPALGIERDMARNPEINKRYYVPREKVRGFYKDIVLLAFPTLKSDRTKQPVRLDNWWQKAGYSKLRNDYSIDKRNISRSEIIDTTQIVVLDSYMDANGRLKWNVPSGEWTILRIGYQPTGRQNHPAPPEGTGLEIDKLSAEALELHWDNTIGKFIQVAGAQAGKTFRGAFIDSYEVGHQNWNKTFYNDFLQQNKYDILHFLPALTGRIVENVETTERFLWDFRKTLGDLIAKNYYEKFAELCHKNDLTCSLEPYGQFAFANDFRISGIADIPVCEFWVFKNHSEHTATAKLVASAAHTYGKKIAGAEAFTGPPERIFEECPYSFKAEGDYFFCRGINRFSYHTFAHDPYDKNPGLGLGSYGSRFDRRNTWWPYVGEYIKYVSRCQYLLQQGQFVADMLYYMGEDAPLSAKLRENLSPVPPYGIDYDFCNNSILEQIIVHEGRLVLPCGMSYRILVLPDLPHIRPEILTIVEKLVADGATVIGRKPLRNPSLLGNEQEMSWLLDNLWGNCDGKNITMHLYGKGKIYWGRSIDSIMNELEIQKDFSFKILNDIDFGKSFYGIDGVEYIHRRIGDSTDIYFVSNQHSQSKKIEAVFRVSGRLPELWHPDSGLAERAATYHAFDDGRIAVTLDLDPSGSVFVVFRETPDNQKKLDKQVILKQKASIDLSNHWEVSFPADSGVPDRIILPSLVSLSEHELYDVRYFSGTATYTKDFDVNKDLLKRGQTIKLDLGNVQVIAEVWLNEKNTGVLWKEPYATDITEFLQTGRNRLEIKVANLWVNRLIGDKIYPDDSEWTDKTGSTAKGMGLAKMPDWVVNNTVRPATQRKTFVAWKWQHLENKEPLPSGLIGPVRLTSYEIIK